MTVTSVALIAFAIGMLLSIFLFRRDLKRIARFLIFHQSGTGDRLACHTVDRELNEVVKAINQQLDAMENEQLDHLREREEFQHQLVNFSHDVRTPLMGAKGYLQLALDEPDRTTRTHYLDNVGERIDDMQGLLDQLHSYTQSVDPETEYNIKNVQLMPMIANVLYGYYPVFEERHWVPDVDFENEGFFAPCDEVAMKRIFDNLISNALKYGSSAPSVKQRERSIWLSNKIEEPMSIDVNRIFERFYQADDARGEGGSGLGLSVVANLARAMKLKIAAEVNDDEFSIRLDFPS